MSGYELKKVIDASVTHFWTADQSQIYRALGVLVADGLAVRSTVAQEDRPNMHLHSITPDGARALDAWLASPLESLPKREPFLARLFFTDQLPPARVLALLDARERQVGEQLAVLETIEIADEPRTLAELLRAGTLDNGIAHARAELEWIETLRRRVEAFPP